MEDSERMRKDNELLYHYMKEARASGWIGAITTVWMFIMSLIPYFDDYYSMIRNWMWIGLLILFLVTPYYVIKTYMQWKKIEKEYGHVVF